MLNKLSMEKAHTINNFQRINSLCKNLFCFFLICHETLWIIFGTLMN